MPDGDKLQPPSSGPAMAAVPPEVLLVCPECRATFRATAFETHLRQAHRIYQFRGVRRSFNDTFAALLDALVADRPDAEAWRALSAIAAENQGSRADIFLATTLGQVLTRVEPERCSTAIDSLGGVIGEGGAISLAAALASDAEILARHLALAVLAHLPQPRDAALIPPLRGLLLDRRLPEERQFAALAAVLRSIGGDEPLVEELLQTLISGLGKTRSIERLRRFERFIGPRPVLDALCEKLEDQVRMSCPRCAIELRRPEMIVHLWEEHRLLLDGRRVRDPWSVIEEWIALYRERREPEWIDHSRTLMQRLDSDDGARRFHRLLLANGIADDEAQRDLNEAAAQQHASCCPSCYALAPVPREGPPLQLNRYRGRLSAGGYRVEVSERGLRTSLEIVTPADLLYEGREPGQFWTRRGVLIVFVGPLVLLALAVACGLIAPHIRPLGTVFTILLAALAVHLGTWWAWRSRVPVEVRARNYAWTMLAPHLHADGYRLEDSAFLAGLARISLEDGYAPLRASLLAELIKRAENALAGGVAPADHLAALRRLAIEDAVAGGADAVPLVVDLLGRCFEGGLSLVFAEHLLAEWKTGWWTPGNRARLRALLCDRAFEAGFEVRNLLDAGQKAPALGAVLATGDAPGLAALRLLWSLRPTRPWDRCGDPWTVYDLAADPRRAELLGRYPDLLLGQEEPDWLVAAPGVTDPEAAHIRFCVRGIYLQGILFTERPRVVEVNARWRYSDLVLGEHRFRSPGQLDALALRMERWFRYAFSEFLPTLPNVEKWPAPDRLAVLRAWGMIHCPECQRPFLPRVGEVGVSLQL
jgi:hypothetical protein